MEDEKKHPVSQSHVQHPRRTVTMIPGDNNSGRNPFGKGSEVAFGAVT